MPLQTVKARRETSVSERRDGGDDVQSGDWGSGDDAARARSRC